jgi:hypothetical protein
MNKKEKQDPLSMTCRADESSRSLQPAAPDALAKIANAKIAKTVGIVWSVLYAIAFPFLVRKAFLSGSLFSDPTLTHTSCYILLFMDIICVLAIPSSMYLAYTSYKKQNFERAHFFAALPFVMFIIYVFLRIEFLDLFLSKTAEAL